MAAAFYPLAFVAAAGRRRRRARHEPDPAGQGAARPRARHQETAEVADADLVLLEHGFQPRSTTRSARSPRARCVDVADVVDLRDSTEDPGEQDPHFWQDPALMATLTDAVADALAEIDPDHAATYRRQRRRAGRRPRPARPATTSRGWPAARGTRSWSRTTRSATWSRFGLHVEGIAGLSPDAEPTPADLARLQELIESDGITTVFSERLVSPRLAQTLADDLGISDRGARPDRGAQRRDRRRGLPVADAREPRRPRGGERMSPTMSDIGSPSGAHRRRRRDRRPSRAARHRPDRRVRASSSR